MEAEAGGGGGRDREEGWRGGGTIFREGEEERVVAARLGDTLP